MKYLITLLVLHVLAASGIVHAAADKRATNTVVLDETGVKNLRLETMEVEETSFESSIFSLGRIETIPSRGGVVSSRIPGRIVSLKVNVGDPVEKDAEVARVESRQPGDPPPTILLTAPLSGLVTASSVRLGEPVAPEKALMEITDLSEVYAIARVPEHLAGKLKAGAVAHIRVSALPDEKFDGVLLRFGTAADKTSGTLDAVFRLPNPGLTLRPDMRAEFNIVLSKRENVLSVPRSALQGDAASRAVYVKDFDLKNAFVKAPVEVGEMNDRFVEILSGLLPGDEVVTRGGYSLAFAGAGSISLKAALDAAHGHEHNADGSEMTSAPKGSHSEKEGDDHDHEHAEGSGFNSLTIFFAASTGVLLLLLMVSALTKRKSAAA